MIDFKQIMKEKRCTQRDLSVKTGINVMRINRIVNNEMQITLAELISILKVLQYTIDIKLIRINKPL